MTDPKSPAERVVEAAVKWFEHGEARELFAAALGDAVSAYLADREKGKCYPPHCNKPEGHYEECMPPAKPKKGGRS